MLRGGCLTYRRPVRRAAEPRADRLTATRAKRGSACWLGSRLLVPAMLGLVVGWLGGCGGQVPTGGAAGDFASPRPVLSDAKDDAEVSSRTVEAAEGFGRADIDKKGSLLFFPHVEIKWDALGRVRQDTFLEITNDFPEDVQVQFYLVNGDPPTDEIYTGAVPVLVERAHPGWNWVNVQFVMTGNEPTYWSVLGGQPKGISPLTLLDPGGAHPPLVGPPGRPDPDPDNPGGRMLRGFVVGWAVADSGHEIVWNHLSGNVVVVDYFNTAAWEYSAWAFAARGVGQGQEPVNCVQRNLDSGQCIESAVNRGTIDLDGFEYDACPGRLQFAFAAAGTLLGNPPVGLVPGDPTVPVIEIDSSLTLGIVDLDLRQDGNGPVTTKARFDIWNQNEVRFSGTEKCLTCWDSALLSDYTTGGVPNHFLASNLQTQLGFARVDGVGSAVCDVNGTAHKWGSPPTDAPLLGVMHKVLRFPVIVEDTPQGGTGPPNGTTGLTVDYVGKSGRSLAGQGYEGASIRYDIIEPPQEAQSGEGG